MLRLRMALSTLALIVGLGSTSQAQMFNQFNQGMGGFGVSGIQGGFQPGFGGFQSVFVGQQFGGFGGYNSYLGAAPYGSGLGVPYYSPYGYYPPVVPQTYNTMGSLMDSIESSTSRRGGWRRWPQQ